MRSPFLKTFFLGVFVMRAYYFGSMFGPPTLDQKAQLMSTPKYPSRSPLRPQISGRPCFQADLEEDEEDQGPCGVLPQKENNNNDDDDDDDVVNHSNHDKHWELKCGARS